MEIDIIYPLIVRSSYFDEKVWDLPHQTFQNNEFILTWVFFRPEESRSNIKRDEYNLHNNTYHNWQQIAFENLRVSGDHFYKNFRKDESTGVRNTECQPVPKLLRKPPFF